MGIDLEEKKLIKRAKSGDESAFEALILSCKGKAYNIALRYMKNEQDALDVLQESFIKIFRHLGKFKEDSQFDTWVYKIVVNTCTDILRKNNTQRNREAHLYHEDEEGNELVADFIDPGPTPEEKVVGNENAAYILDCLNTMSDEHREVLILRDMQGMSYEEISEILDSNIGTVKSRLNRARIKLRDIYLKNREQNERDYV
ncbi:MAG: sigma-70 family RNA polymerase sigma factor [Anaerovorax sp.]